MKLFKSVILYLCTSVVPCILLYLVFDGVLLKVTTTLLLVTWGLLYLYIDKVLLILLNAREVIDTDQQILFQNIKNEAYKTYQKLPKVYLYTGQEDNCFVLESRNEWAIVIERSLLNSLDVEQHESLVNFLFSFKKSGKAWFQTKAMGVCSFAYNALYWVLNNVFFLKRDSILFRTLSVFAIGMLRPFIIPLEYFGKQKIEVPVDESLRSIYLQLNKNSFSFTDYLVGHLDQVTDTRSLLTKYLESYPVMENCRFHENEA